MNNTLIILSGDGHGGFTAAASPKAGSYPVSLAAADFDGDGKTDLAVADGASNSVTILHGNGDGTFTLEPTSPATGNFPLQIISADFNSDGKADLAITNQGDGTVTILLGNGNGSFTAAPTLPAVNSYAEDVAVADMNGDGIPDLVVSNDKYYAETILPDPVTVWIGAGNGTFTAGVSPASGREPEALIAADFNGDGRSDLAVLNAFDDQLSILLTANEIATASVTGVPVGSAARLPFVTASYPGDSYHHASSSRGSTQVPSAIFLSPASINFGVGYVDSGAYYWPAMLANGGTQIVDLTRFAFSRPDGSSFGLRNSTCGASVAPGANCSFSIAFRPTKEGNLTSNFQVYVSDSTSPLQMPLEGFGEGFPVVQLTPSLITFAPTYVGTTAGYQSLTLTNTGTGTLAIYSISIVSEYDPYSWGIRNQTCGNTLAPGASCTLSVAFRPTRADSIAGAVAVIDNFNSGEQTVSLRGTGK